MKKALFFWLPVVLYMGLIFYLSSQSSFPMEVPPWMFYWDKFVHACLFGGLAWLILRAWTQGNWKEASLMAVLISAALSSLYGVTDEIHQLFVPDRSPDVFDWIADTVGALSSGLLTYTWTHRKSEVPVVTG